jgi:UDP-N-acetylmuramate dehydrogenase
MEKHILQSLLSKHEVGAVYFDEPMSKHTTWKVGGPADVFVVPTKIEHIQRLMNICTDHALPWHVIGRGSNLLVRDGGIRGVVIKLADNFSQISLENDFCVRAESGRSYVSCANFSMRNGLSGLEFATGIPGTVGGAVMMNAGAHGSETKDVLLHAEIVEADGTISRLSNADLHFEYRYSILKDHPRIVVSATFQLKQGDTEKMLETVRGWTKRRQTTQPLQLPSCGSVFRNPEHTHAGFLIEQSGLKGKKIGGAQISELHGNFIVNLGNARASDILQLIELAQTTILEKYGISLIPEVRIVGEDV